MKKKLIAGGVSFLLGLLLWIAVRPFNSGLGVVMGTVLGLFVFAFIAHGEKPDV